MKKFIVTLMFALLVSSSSFAWKEPSKAFPAKLGANLGSSFTVSTTTDLILMQTSSLGFSIPSPTNAPPVYGISGGYDLIIAQDTGTADGLNVNVVPLIGAGVDVFLDAAPLINGGQAPTAMFGFNMIGPDLSHFINIAGVTDVVPAANFLWNLNNNGFVTTIGLRAPLGIFSNDGVTKITSF